MDEYLGIYLDYLEGRNRSERTVAQYKKILTHFFMFLQEKGVSQVHHIETIHIDLYQSSLIKVGNVSSSRSKKASVLRSFFAFLFSRKYIKENPAAALEPIKIKDVDRKKRETLTIDEAIRLLEKIEENSTALLKERNKLIVMVFLFCGLRVSELCHLQWSDVEFSRQTLYIRGKGGKIREIPLDEVLTKELKSYSKKQMKKSTYVFTVKSSGKPLEERAVLDLIKHHAKKAKIKKNIGCHSLRRTSATVLLEGDVSIRKIQMFLGHSSINTTMLYLDPDLEETKKEIREKNPLGKKLKKARKSKNAVPKG